MFKDVFSLFAIAAAPVVPMSFFDVGTTGASDKHISTVSFSREMKFGPLLNSYFGGIGTPNVPLRTSVDYSESIRSMWDEKTARPNVSRATKKNANKIVERFEREEPIYLSIQDVAWIAYQDVRSSQDEIDWFALCDRMKLNARQCENSITTSKQINGTTLVSYSMTELMPGTNGKLNVELYDKLLQTAGWTYITAIPALYDDKLSFGPYQFTSFAVYDDGKKQEGASVVSKYSNRKIAGSVVHLANNDQHVAAGYFAIYNIMRANKRFKYGVNPKCFNGANLPIFIATAHNNPSQAIGAMTKYVRNQCSGNILNGYTNNSVKGYGIKTLVNFTALSEMI